MSERGIDDIEFDFFDEPGEEDITQRRRAVRPQGPRGPRRPLRPPAGFTPLLRLVGLIAAAILVVVLLVFWVQGCREDKKVDSYKSYLGDLTKVAQSSQQVGNQFNSLLTTVGIKQNVLATKLDGLAQQEQQDVAQARKLDPPGRLREANRHVIEALQFRVNGLAGLAEALRKTTASTDADTAGELLAAQAQRLVTSDVLWDDLFKEPTTRILEEEDIRGVSVPDSNFIDNPDLASARTFSIFFERIRGASTGGVPSGLHGNALVSTRALPSGDTLSTSTETTVVASTSLAFEVTVENSGEHQEVRVPVTLTIEKEGSPIVKAQTIDVIDPGETKTVTFRDIDTTGVFGVRTNVKVEVKKVPGETRLTNNSATYPVIFSLGP
jgi:CARDB